MPTRRRRCPPRSRKALRDYPQLFRSRPSTAATRVNNFKATDVASVSKVIHTDNQLQAGQFGKAAYTGWIRIVNKRLVKTPFLVGDRPTIADVSLAGYLYYPVEEFGFDIGKDHPAIGAWRERVKALPGWGHPYDLMPGHPIKAA